MMTDRFYFVVCSLGENENLKVCLDSLLQIKKNSKVQVEVLLVINKSETSERFDSRIHVGYEPRKGYSSVRNKAISLIPNNTNVIFLDDDEIPTHDWFDALIKANKKNRADVIFGPVYPFKQSNKISYRSQASERYKELSDGDLVHQAPTANMLIPAHLLDKRLIYFDPIFNKSGSEDTDLCFRLRNLGVKIRFAKEAILYEKEKLQRFDSDYLIARRRKDIANYSLVIRRNAGIRRILWRFSTLLIRIVFYSFLKLFKSKYKNDLDAYYSSIKVLISGKPLDN